MRQRTLGIIAGVLLLSGAALGAVTVIAADRASTLPSTAILARPGHRPPFPGHAGPGLQPPRSGGQPGRGPAQPGP